MRYRTVKAMKRKYKIVTTGNTARCKVNFHADTCVARPNFRFEEYTAEHCDVTPYLSEYEPMSNIPIVNALTAYTDKDTEEP
jgi:hypothetical protein